ncbi:MAG: DUF1844 domain-containing protein [Candidatus Krumholzibacteriota bacterium]|nr:DUF1844 domain-containing protein [Candidatus Krumholzibacteriota bacterium]
MNGYEDDLSERDGFLFQHLIAMFQTLALQQMGKLMNPLTGAVERDLHQARITIDMLEMISTRTAGNLSDTESRILDNVLMELRMNFVDESSRPEPKDGDGAEEATTADEPPAEGEETESTDAGGDADGEEDATGRT